MRRLAILVGSAVIGASLPVAAVARAGAPIASRSPLTIPAIQQWHPAPGVWRLRASTEIDAARDQPVAVKQARVLAADLAHLTGGFVPVVIGARPDSTDIVLRTVPPDVQLGREGYRLDIGRAFTISAPTGAGLFYGGRTLLQLLHEGRTVPDGRAVDWPRYPERGLMVDASRTTYSTRWVLREIRQLAAVKLNLLHLHLTDDQRWGIASQAAPDLASKGAFTRPDIKRILALARRDHVSVIPEIEMPGHMAAFLSHHPALRLEPLGVIDPASTQAYFTDKLDITKPAALKAVRRLLDEYLPLFPGHYWDLGADEYLSPAQYAEFPQLAVYATKRYGVGATPGDAIHGFINWVDRIVRAHGKVLRIWNDQVGLGGRVPVNRDVVIEWWDSFSPDGDSLTVSPQTLIDDGYRVLNAGWYPNYYTPDIGPVSGKASLPGVYSSWRVSDFDGTDLTSGLILSKQSVAPDSPKLLGAQVNIWGPLDETTAQTASWVEPHLAVLAQKTWDSPLPSATYAGFASDMRRVGLP